MTKDDWVSKWQNDFMLLAAKAYLSQQCKPSNFGIEYAAFVVDLRDKIGRAWDSAQPGSLPPKGAK